MRTGKYRAIWRGILTVLIVGLAFGGWQVFQWQARLVDIGGVRVDPLVELDLNQRYEVVLWEPDLYIPGSGTAPQRQAVMEAVRELSRIYPNISVEVVFIDPAELPDKVQEALDAGVPPDVAGTMLGHRFDTALQVPVSPYVSEMSQTDLALPAVAAVTADNTIWAWPRWMTLDLWLHHGSVHGSSLASGALSGDAFIARAQAVRPNGMHGLAYNAYDPFLMAGMITATTGKGLFDQTGALQWTAEDMLKAASFLQSLQQQELIPENSEHMSRSRLEHFWEKQAAAIAPVNNLLLHHALTRVGELTHSEGAGDVTTSSNSVLAVTSPPHLDDHLGGVSGQVAGYAVFRREPHVGDDHTKAVMVVAEHLSRRLGLWQASRLLAIPAHPSAIGNWEIGSGLPRIQAASMLTLAERLVAPAVIRHVAVSEHEALAKVIAPKLPDLLTGKLEPEAFAEAVQRELGAIAATRMGSSLATQP